MRDRYFYCYLALLCWLPLPMGGKSILAQQVFIFFTNLLICSCCVEYILRSDFQWPIALRKATPVYWLFAFYVGWIFLQTLPLPLDWLSALSPNRAKYVEAPYVAAISFSTWTTHHNAFLSMSYFSMFVLTLLMVDSQRRLQILLYTILFLGVFQSVYGSFMTLSGIEKTWWFKKEAHVGVATGTLLNRNHLANYLTFSVASGIGLLLSIPSLPMNTWRERARALITWLLGAKGFVRLSIIIAVIGLILTHSRMGNIAFITSMTSAGFIWLVLGRKINKTTMVLFASLLLIDIFLMGSWFGIEAIAERIENTTADTEMRHQMLPYMMSMAKDFWVTGTGAGTFADTFPLYKQAMTFVWYNEAHCDYLQFFIEDGVVGLLPLIAIVLFSLVKTIQTIRYRHSPLLVATGFTVLMGLIATGIHASVEYTLQRPATAGLFVIFLALPWVTAHMESENGSRASKRRHI